MPTVAALKGRELISFSVAWLLPWMRGKWCVEWPSGWRFRVLSIDSLPLLILHASFSPLNMKWSLSNSSRVEAGLLSIVLKHHVCQWPHFGEDLDCVVVWTSLECSSKHDMILLLAKAFICLAASLWYWNSGFFWCGEGIYWHDFPSYTCKMMPVVPVGFLPIPSQPWPQPSSFNLAYIIPAWGILGLVGCTFFFSRQKLFCLLTCSVAVNLQSISLLCNHFEEVSIPPVCSFEEGRMLHVQLWSCYVHLLYSALKVTQCCFTYFCMQVNMKTHAGYMAGMQKEFASCSMPYYATSSEEVLFHVATRMSSMSLRIEQKVCT